MNIKTVYKNLFVISLPIVLLATGTPFSFATVVPAFPDVEEGETFFVPVNYLKTNGLVEGYEDGTFQPHREVNRAEALKILLEAFPVETPTEDELPPDDQAIQPDQIETATDETVTQTKIFEDVTPDAWYAKYVETALSSGVVEGYPDGKFHPEKTINRVEALKIVLLHENPDFDLKKTEPLYSDITANNWFAPYAAESLDRTLFLPSRNGANLEPDDTVSRAEFAELIYRLIKSKDQSLFARATWYGSEGVNWGTASGEPFDVNKMATAHKTLPFGTLLRVTNQANGKSIIVEVNDRGPYATGVDIDLTQTAFSEIASVGAGIIITEYEVMQLPPSDTEPDEQITPIIEYGF